MNKKLIKVLGCLVGISFVGSIVPTISVSCGNNNKTNVIPKEAYDIEINEEGDVILKGWNQDKGWNAEKIKNEGYDTMIIPESVTIIYSRAFRNNTYTLFNMPPLNLVLNSNLTTVENYAFQQTPLISIDFSKCKNLQTIGDSSFTGNKSWKTDYSSLTTLDLSYCTKLTSIGTNCFWCHKKLTSVTFPGSLNTIGQNALGSKEESRNFSIVWNDLKSEPTGVYDKAFDLGSNRSDTGTVHSNNDIYTSKDLLNFLITHGLPSTGWDAI